MRCFYHQWEPWRSPSWSHFTLFRTVRNCWVVWVDVGPGRFMRSAYVEILGRVFLTLVMAMVFSELKPFYLIQDNSPINTSSVVTERLWQHRKIMRCHIHPKSPDLNFNFIKNVWVAMGYPDIPAIFRSSMPKQLWLGSNSTLHPDVS